MLITLKIKKMQTQPTQAYTSGNYETLLKGCQFWWETQFLSTFYHGAIKQDYSIPAYDYPDKDKTLFNKIKMFYERQYIQKVSKITIYERINEFPDRDIDTIVSTITEDEIIITGPDRSPWFYYSINTFFDLRRRTIQRGFEGTEDVAAWRKEYKNRGYGIVAGNP